MLKTPQRFYILAFGLMLAASLLLVLLQLAGDIADVPVAARLNYRPEGRSGFPEITLTFLDSARLPERASVEAAFETDPPLIGDFNWDGPNLNFIAGTRLLSDTEYRVRLRGGLRLSGGGRAGYSQLEWTFHTRPLRVAYLKQEGPAVNIWLYVGQGQNPRPLTFETERKVLDFSVSPGGERLVYSLQEANGLEAGLWLTHTGPDAAPSDGSGPVRLVYESKLRATLPRWSPGGDLIAYERRFVLERGFTKPELWLVKADGTDLPPLYGGYERTGVSLEWASGGDRAFFWEPRREALGIFNFSGELSWQDWPRLKLAGLAPAPDGRDLIVAQFDYSGPQERQVLSRWTVAKGSGTKAGWQLNTLQPPDQAGYNDRSPAWSPDGRKVAFVRQEMGAAGGRPGRIWVFDAATGQTAPLPAGQATQRYSQGAFQWSPDSRTILFEQYPAGERRAGESSEVWTCDVDGQNLRRLLAGAFAPRWLI